MNARILALFWQLIEVPYSKVHQITQPAVLFVTPTHQYPLGGILPYSERLRLLNWASQTDSWIIEDDYDSEFHFYQQSIQAMQGLTKDSRVIYIGSFSKTLMSTLRLGFMVLPAELMPDFIDKKTLLSGPSPLPAQMAVTAFIERGFYARHLRKMRQVYKQKWQHTVHLINTELNGLAKPVYQNAGMHIALQFDNSIDDGQVKQLLQAKGFGGTALSSYYLAAPKSGLVLGFANTSEQQRTIGIKTLREILHSHY